MQIPKPFQQTDTVRAPLAAAGASLAPEASRPPLLWPPRPEDSLVSYSERSSGSDSTS